MNSDATQITASISNEDSTTVNSISHEGFLQMLKKENNTLKAENKSS